MTEAWKPGDEASREGWRATIEALPLLGEKGGCIRYANGNLAVVDFDTLTRLPAPMITLPLDVVNDAERALRVVRAYSKTTFSNERRVSQAFTAAVQKAKEVT